MYSDDHYNFNYAQAIAATGNYKEAEEVWDCYAVKRLELIKIFFQQSLKSDLVFKLLELFFFGRGEDGYTSFNILLIKWCFKSI